MSFHAKLPKERLYAGRIGAESISSDIFVKLALAT